MQNIPNEQSPTPIMKSQDDLLCFPHSLITGMKFNTVDQIRNYLQKIANSLHLPQLGQIFYVKHCYKLNQLKSLTLRCKFCKASCNFVVKNHIITTSVRNLHTHGLKQITLQKIIKCRTNKKKPYIHINHQQNLPSSNDSSIKIKQSQVGNNTQPHPIQAIKLQYPQEQRKNQLINLCQLSNTEVSNPQKQSQSSTFQQLDQWLITNQYDCRIEWAGEPRDKFPRLMVLVSPTMKSNYSKYSDLVSFDICYDILRNVTNDGRNYQIAVYSVNDTNMRLLLAGIVIFADQTTLTMSKIFKYFIDIHQKSPSTIVTDDKPAINQAINQHRQNNIFTGNHLLTHWYLLRSASCKLNGSFEQVAKIMSQLAASMSVRSVEQYDQLINALKNNPISRDLIQQLIKKKEQIFYCDMPNSFIGLKRNNCQKIIDWCRISFPDKTNIVDFIGKTRCLDDQLSVKSIHLYDVYNEEAQVHLGNTRLAEVRRYFEREIVQRFIENYLKGLKQYKLVDNSISTFVVHSVNSDTKFIVRDWRCQCKEYEKTGVACPHIIMAATTVRSKSYVDLISRRWRKELPVVFGLE